MPTAAFKQCAYPGCYKAIPGGTRHCPKHAEVAKKQEKRQQRAYNKARGTPASRGYGSDWQKIRLEVLAEEPYCRGGCGERATQVDHIDGNPRNNARSNLAPYCRRCHSSKTATFDGGYGNRRP